MKNTQSKDLCFLFFFSLNSFLLINDAHADDETAAEPKVVYKSKTEIDFEAIDVEGQLIKPNAAVVTERRAAKFHPLIKLRTDFDKEMDDSVNEIK